MPPVVPTAPSPPKGKGKTPRFNGTFMRDAAAARAAQAVAMRDADSEHRRASQAAAAATIQNQWRHRQAKEAVAKRRRQAQAAAAPVAAAPAATAVVAGSGASAVAALRAGPVAPNANAASSGAPAEDRRPRREPVVQTIQNEWRHRQAVTAVKQQKRLAAGRA